MRPARRAVPAGTAAGRAAHAPAWTGLATLALPARWGLEPPLFGDPAAGDLVDRLLAVTAMLVAVAPIVRGACGGRGEVSWRRVLLLVAGGLFALAAVTGLLVLRFRLLREEVVYLPTSLGGTLVAFGGALGVATLLASRRTRDGGRGGMTEDAAIRNATLAAAMSVYPAAPLPVLGALALTWLLRSTLPWTVAQARWAGVALGLLLLALCFVARSPELGGLRQATTLFDGL